MDKLLEGMGLSKTQTVVYLYLLNNGESTPPVVASKLSLTRTNAYKVLDSLTELGIVRKQEINKKIVYTAEDPIALQGLVARERNRVITIEQSAREAMHELRAAYERTNTGLEVHTYRGEQAVRSLVIDMARKSEPVYGITSPTANIRSTTLYHEVLSKLKNIRVVGLPHNSNDSRVDWFACGDELIVINVNGGPTALRIEDRAITSAFETLWSQLNN